MHTHYRTSSFIRSAWALPLALTVALAGCGSQGSSENDAAAADATASDEAAAVATARESISDETDNGHAIAVSGEEASYTSVDVTKTGEADGDEADFY